MYAETSFRITTIAPLDPVQRSDSDNDNHELDYNNKISERKIIEATLFLSGKQQSQQAFHRLAPPNSKRMC